MKSVTLNVDFVDLSTTWKEKQTKENKKRLRAQMQPISPCGRCDFQ